MNGWIFTVDDDCILVGFYKPDGKGSFPFTYKKDELQEALQMVNYLNGGDGRQISKATNEAFENDWR